MKILKYLGIVFVGSPFKFHVDSLSSGYVTAYGPGLTHGVCGEPSNFTISTKGAGAGTFRIKIFNSFCVLIDLAVVSICYLRVTCIIKESVSCIEVYIVHM
jgi:uncharacterized membrane protein YhdT